VLAWLSVLSEEASKVEPDDGELLRLAQADRQAFTLLYQRYVAPVYNYCYLRLGSREAAEDAASETFLRALAGLPDFQGGTVAAWLFRIAHNIIVDLYRKRRPQQPLTEADDLPDPAPSAEHTLLERDELARVQAAINRLPDDQRSVLELQFAGWSGKQIAAVLGRSHGAVRMLHLRAVERLRQLLLDEDEPQ